MARSYKYMFSREMRILAVLYLAPVAGYATSSKDVAAMLVPPHDMRELIERKGVAGRTANEKRAISAALMILETVETPT